MARMVPFPMLPTASSAERRLYEGFLSQLSDEYVVYHSVPWNLEPDRPGGTRIEGEADFVIAHPEDGILVLEAKGGQLSYDPDSKRWFQAGREGRHPMDEDPFHQAQDEMHSLIDILSHQPGWGKWKPSYGYGVAFPDGLYTVDAHPGAPASIAIDHDDMDRLGSRVKQIMSTYRRPGRRFGAEGMEALERTLGMRVEIRTPLGLLFGEEERRIVELTNDQMFALTYVLHRGRAAIVGPAGSGKTILALELAKRLAAGDHRTLLTCFNRRLGEYLREAAGGSPNLDVFHFHDLCRHLAEAAGLVVPSPPSDEGAATQYFEQTLPGLLETAADVLGPRYDAMVVDEAQDFRAGWWPILMRFHVRPEDGYLFVFADNNQNLYGGGVPSSLVNVEVPLLNNLRNTKQIHEFVSIHFDGDFRPKAGGPEGRPVEVLSYRDEDDLARLLALVLKNLEAEHVPLEDVVVLTPARAAKSPLRQRGHVDGYRLMDQPDRKPGEVLTTTIHSFKGLERPVVILAELGERHDEDLEPYLYVGGSRAKNHLIVLATEPVARQLRVLAGVEHA
jgi:Nuclease-related domain/UvrD-like helicase C-terminal domain/AAA domain